MLKLLMRPFCVFFFEHHFSPPFTAHLFLETICTKDVTGYENFLLTNSSVHHIRLRRSGKTANR